MPEYATVRVDEDAIDDARKIKEQFEEDWKDVFEFYTENRPEYGAARKWTEGEVRDVAGDEARSVVEEFRR